MSLPLRVQEEWHPRSPGKNAACSPVPLPQASGKGLPVDTNAARPLPPSTGIWPTVLQPTKAPATVSVFLREAAVLPLPGAKTPVAEASFLFAQ